VTILYSASTGRLAWYEFPDDPKLTTAAQFFGAARRRPDATAVDRILRYVPRRRLTFRTSGRDDTGATIIGKFVRPAEAEPAWDRLVKVSRAVRGSPGPFSTAAPLGVDDRHHVFFQEARPGQPLAGRLEASNVNGLVRRLGAVHRAIHELQVRHVSEWNPAAFVQILREQVKWVAFFTPEQAGLLDGVLTPLLACAPRMDPRDYTFCHGDFRCSQILTDGDRWSVIDFDGSLRADPYLEIAHVLAFLKYDVPWCIRRFEEGEDHLLDEVYESYLSGYQERASRELDRRRLLWYRIGCEIHCLARMIRRDLAHPVTFARALRLVRTLSEQLE
jgi:thiamine kinase-like enzyme